MAKTLIVKTKIAKAGWNKHLPVPLKEGEKVFIHPKQVNAEGKPIPKDSIKVIHNKGKSVGIFLKEHFFKEKQ